MEILQNLGSLPIFFIMFIIIYFLMIRPQLKQQKNHKVLINNLKKGDKIVTQTGICGIIIDFKGNNKVLINTGNESKILILKNYIISMDE